jgi:hypothetical protein
MKRCSKCWQLWLLIVVLLQVLSGCARTVAFGTATKFGLDISQRPDQTIDVTLGYDREEIATIPAPEAVANKSEDTYSLLGIFYVDYGNPWRDEPLRLNQFFATGWAARAAAADKRLQAFFGKKAADISKRGTDEK